MFQSTCRGGLIRNWASNRSAHRTNRATSTRC
jgi:hypothetical protein